MTSKHRSPVITVFKVVLNFSPFYGSMYSTRGDRMAMCVSRSGGAVLAISTKDLQTECNVYSLGVKHVFTFREVKLHYDHTMYL